MATLKDIARFISSSSDMKGRDAENFVTAIVDTILEGLENERLVKIKGFGTFKLSAVKERESVNVNNGERVIINGHDKITFTPENSVRDLINKPFAQFETVILNESVDMNLMIEIPEDGPDQILQEKDEPIVAQPPINTILANENKESEKEEISQQTINETMETVKENKKQMTEPVLADISDKSIDKIVQELKKSIAVNELDEEYEQETVHSFPYKDVLTYVLIAILFFLIGCFVGYKNYLPEGLMPVQEVEVQKTVVAEDTIQNISQPVRTDTTTKTAPTSENTVDNETAKETQPANDNSKYNSDARIRTGAYIICGIDKTITAGKGQTLQSIARSYLGNGMECYVEAVNDYKTIKDGDKVNLPKLKLKKTNKK